MYHCPSKSKSGYLANHHSKTCHRVYVLVLQPTRSKQQTDTCNHIVPTIMLPQCSLVRYFVHALDAGSQARAQARILLAIPTALGHLR